MTRPRLAERAARAGLRPPGALTVAITGQCNLRCAHCWVEAGTGAAPGHAPTEAVIRLADGLAALGGDTLWLSGGEPLAHPAWPAILARCCAVPSLRTVGLQTNGVLLDADAVETLRTVPGDKLRLEVSLDGESARTHDRVRGRGAFDATMQALSRLAAAGLGGRTTVAFTEMRHNMDDLAQLLRVVDDLGLRGLVAGTLVRDGRAADAALEPPTPAQYQALVERYDRDARFRERYARSGSFPALEWWKGRAAARGDPCTFLAHPYVSAAGLLYPCRLCHADDFAVGDAFARPFAEVVEEALARAAELREIARRRAARIPECGGCPAKDACAGGCMGRALATRGSLEHADDRCPLRRAVRRRDEGGGAAFPARDVGLSFRRGRAGGQGPSVTPRRPAREVTLVAKPPPVAPGSGPEHIRCMDIHELLAEERSAIVEDAWRSILALTHYERDGKEVTRERVEALYDHVARAIRLRDLGELLDYSERIARQRFEAKFDLMEVQTAYFMLEEAIGRRALARISPDDLAEALGLVGTAIRRGKDALARAYISLTNRKRAPSLDLSDLFKGR